ncbi:unnamed protein product, partial [Mesorhabditis spiculigera]
MKVAILIVLAACAYAAPREKRFAALGLAASGIGGATGCVVTGTTLYANGFKQRQLNDDEMSELEQYQVKLVDYKKKLKAALEKRRDSMKRRMTANSEMTKDEENSIAQSADLKAPTKPSFCKEEDTTQYIFDGCMVQSNKVYIGREYARDLTESEIVQLKDFDEKMTVYQKWAQKQMQKQMKGLFGGSDFFSALFGGEGPAGRQQQTPTTPEPEENAPDAPDAPKICTAIY